jgi:hypothetical protein
MIPEYNQDHVYTPRHKVNIVIQWVLMQGYVCIGYPAYVLQA